MNTCWGGARLCSGGVILGPGQTGSGASSRGDGSGVILAPGRQGPCDTLFPSRCLEEPSRAGKAAPHSPQRCWELRRLLCGLEVSFQGP